MKTFLLLFIILLTGFNPLVAQEPDDDDEKEKAKIAPFIIGGVTAGGNIDQGNFVYTDGWSVNGGLAWKKSKRVAIGLGAGIEKLENVTFLPAGITILGFTSKKDESTVFGLQTGYAHGYSDRLFSMIHYKFRGGLYFNPFIGYKTELKKTDLMLTIGYKHQFAESIYSPEQGKRFSERNSYHLISFRAGILF